MAPLFRVPVHTNQCSSSSLLIGEPPSKCTININPNHKSSGMTLLSDDDIDHSLGSETSQCNDPSKPALKSCFAGKTRRGTKHNVRFDQVEFREYQVVLGDNPSVSAGPPISLGWTYDADTLVSDINLYEFQRVNIRREKCCLRIPAVARMDMLLGAGHTLREIEMVVNEVREYQNRVYGSRVHQAYYSFMVKSYKMKKSIKRLVPKRPKATKPPKYLGRRDSLELSKWFGNSVYSLDLKYHAQPYFKLVSLRPSQRDSLELLNWLGSLEFSLDLKYHAQLYSPTPSFDASLNAIMMYF